MGLAGLDLERAVEPDHVLADLQRHVLAVVAGPIVDPGLELEGRLRVIDGQDVHGEGADLAALAWGERLPDAVGSGGLLAVAS